MADPLNSDTAPESGTGSDADRLSMSPLSLRRGGADPVDINPEPLNLDFGPRNDYANPRQPSAPISETGAGAK